MKCPSCGFENEAGVRFCGSCGTKMSEEPPQTPSGKLVCPNCGLENPSDAQFGQNCGQAILRMARIMLADKYKEREKDGSLSEWGRTALVVEIQLNYS